MKNHNNFKSVFIVLFVFFISFPVNSDSNSIKKKPYIAFFYSHQDRFWDDFIACMNACADNMGIELRTYCADYSRDTMVNQIKKVIQSDEKPDFIMFAPFKSIGYHILKLTEESGIKTFIVNSGLSLISKNYLSESGLNPEFLLGEFLPGDENAGYEQMQILLSAARKKGMLNSSGKIEAVAINGNIEDDAGFYREKGLKIAISEPDDLMFHQIFFAPHWDTSESRLLIPNIMKRYPGTRVVWCANDGIALGVIEACRALNLKPGKDILIGGIDWSGVGIKGVMNNDFQVDFGGHFFDGAWALIILYDYYYGYNRDISYINLNSVMLPITKKNLAFYAPLIFKNRNAFYKSINFSSFSKKHNPGIKNYSFSIRRIIN